MLEWADDGEEKTDFGSRSAAVCMLYLCTVPSTSLETGSSIPPNLGDPDDPTQDYSQ